MNSEFLDWKSGWPFSTDDWNEEDKWEVVWGHTEGEGVEYSWNKIYENWKHCKESSLPNSPSFCVSWSSCLFFFLKPFHSKSEVNKIDRFKSGEMDTKR